jgi:hypothetical protein
MKKIGNKNKTVKQSKKDKKGIKMKRGVVAK